MPLNCACKNKRAVKNCSEKKQKKYQCSSESAQTTVKSNVNAAAITFHAQIDKFKAKLVKFQARIAEFKVKFANLRMKFLARKVKFQAKIAKITKF